MLLNALDCRKACPVYLDTDSYEFMFIIYFLGNIYFSKKIFLHCRIILTSSCENIDDAIWPPMRKIWEKNGRI